ncbi:Zinc-dependent alcohol dehydrogenase [Acidilobus saccharovorans 345-15]|uniref:Zinc-dependent alcohol dehydrogenase n=1 Tax=Acidilobus saccharovorans (strain DSM 16705 / JCM 18335 / VKM B-2471 / 345-15) TaxID=666510 RepID=D9Q209_ACIS3|nr:zinc-binding dehydrogenase [Acidilobus saccharovorans]ADL19347.1 Zinc-dependent alcohol dehydrogenase [Acidilobus saccharovorans 345-15]
MVRARAAILREFGRQFDIDYVDINAEGNDVIVKVKSVGVCGRDIVVWRGGFRNLKPPLVLGHEVFGVTEDGEPVGVYPADPGSEEFLPLGERRPGGYAELMAAPRSNIVRLPDEEFDKYAAATCGVATLIHASRVVGVRPGDRVLVTGASGGVGIHGVQYLSNVLHANVIAYVRSKEKAHVLEGLGVSVVTDLSFYRSLGRVDYVFEIVGAPLINESMRSLRRGGELVLVGNVTGEPISIERPALLVMRELKISGTSAYTKSEYEEAVKLIGEGLVKPFYKAYRLDDVNLAYSDILNGKALGRAVLKP